MPKNYTKQEKHAREEEKELAAYYPSYEDLTPLDMIYDKIEVL